MTLRGPAPSHPRAAFVAAAMLLIVGISVAIGVAFRSPREAFAGESGWLNATTVTDGTSVCYLPQNVLAGDGNSATCLGGQSFLLSGFDFAGAGITAGATNIRFAMRVVAGVAPGGSGTAANLRLSWGNFASGTLIPNQPFAAAGTGLAEYLVPSDGGCSDFGHTWTVDELSAGNFGFRLTSATDELAVDHVQLKVCWDGGVVAAPDLTVAKSASVATIGYNNTFDYEIALKNDAGTAAFADGDVVFEDTLPANVTYVSHMVDALAATGLAGTVTCSNSGQDFACVASGPVSLGANASVPLSITVRATGITGPIVNPPTGGTCGIDPDNVIANEEDELNNACPATSVALAIPDLVVAKTNDVGGVVALLGAFNWTLTVTNEGDLDAQFPPGAVVLSDALPDGPTYAAAVATTTLSAAQGSGSLACSVAAGPAFVCTASGGPLVLKAGQSFAAAITVTNAQLPGGAEGDLVNAASSCLVDPPQVPGGSGSVVEADETNNTCPLTSVEVLAERGDLEVTKTVDWNGYPALTGATFDICITGPEYPDGDCKDVSTASPVSWTGILAGGYTVTETDSGAGWETTSSQNVLVPANGSVSAIVENVHKPFVTLTATSTCSDDSAVRVWRVSNPNPYEVTFDWAMGGTAGSGSVAGNDSVQVNVAGATDDTFVVAINGVEQARVTQANYACTATIAVAKIVTNIAGDTTAFTVAASPGDATGTVTEATIATLTVPLTDGAAAVTLTETPLAGYVLSGWSLLTSAGHACAAAPEHTGGPVAFDVASYETPFVCLYNTAVGSIVIEKTDETGGGPWVFTASGPGGVVANATIDGSGTVTIPRVPVGGPYTVTEVNGSRLGACPVPNEAAGNFLTSHASGANGLTIDSAAQVITFAFTNTPCALVLGSGGLIIEKVQDIDGDGVHDPGEPFAAWEVTIDGPDHPGGAVLDIPAGGLALTDLTDGDYRIAEGARDGYELVGVRIDGGPLVASGTADVSVTNGVTTRVTFYNQPSFAIEVRATSIDNDAMTAGAGWTIVLAGCGIAARTGITDAAGIATFGGLDLPLHCDYSIAEAAQPGWAVAPAAVQQVGQATPGATVPVRFTNIRAVAGCAPECQYPVSGPDVATPTATPPASVTATPPPDGSATAISPTGTATPPDTVVPSPADPGTATASPGAPSTTARPGPSHGAGTTPAAPSAGFGRSGGGTTQIPLAAGGLLAMSLGFALIARRR